MFLTTESPITLGETTNLVVMEFSLDSLLEFPWNFYGFRDILTPKCYENDVLFLWIRSMSSATVTHAVGLAESPGRESPGSEEREEESGNLRNKKLRKSRSWPDWS